MLSLKTYQLIDLYTSEDVIVAVVPSSIALSYDVTAVYFDSLVLFGLYLSSIPASVLVGRHSTVSLLNRPSLRRFHRLSYYIGKLIQWSHAQCDHVMPIMCGKIPSGAAKDNVDLVAENFLKSRCTMLQLIAQVHRYNLV